MTTTTRRHDPKMALPDTKSNADTRILYPYKNLQTYHGRKTYHIGLQRPNRTLLQPISQSQASYLKDTTVFMNFIEKKVIIIEQSLFRWM